MTLSNLCAVPPLNHNSLRCSQLSIVLLLSNFFRKEQFSGMREFLPVISTAQFSEFNRRGFDQTHVSGEQHSAIALGFAGFES